MNRHVQKWQQHLNDIGEAIATDGDFGPVTLAASIRATERDDEPNKSAIDVPLPKFKTALPRLPKLSRNVNELIWHCAATPEGKDFTVDQIRRWHKARGWSDIGYHFIVYRDGSIHPGRPLNKIGAHVAGRNTNTIGAVYIGGVSRDGRAAKDTRTPEQKSAMLALTQAIAKKYPIKRISGHNEFAAKACPSFDVWTDAVGNIPGFSKGRKQ